MSDAYLFAYIDIIKHYQHHITFLYLLSTPVLRAKIMPSTKVGPEAANQKDGLQEQYKHNTDSKISPVSGDYPSYFQL